MSSDDRAGRAGVPRIFWLGMHKILVETEFRLLQTMGYEVFRPPYLTEVLDQSVSTSLDFGNARLPPDIAMRLSGTNFFYSAIAPDIAEILNAFFDAVVVTINPDWLKQTLKAFRGTVIYRCYGQLGPVSESLVVNGCRPLIEQRNGFHYWPHAPECVEAEDAWLTSSATVVPYWLTNDVLTLRGRWNEAAAERRPSIALACPNISNVYYNAHFRYLKRFFEERCFRYYGVQIEPNADLNVVGTLPRARQLERLAGESGFLYTYRERTVCYLPPIEMMVLGGPVLYLPGSLLARYFDQASPGLVRDEAAAVVQSKRLIRGDLGLVREIVASQAPVLYRYDPAYGEGIFRAEFERIVPLPRGEPPVTFAARKPVLLLAHFDGYLERNGRFASIHGIPRVMRRFVQALTEAGVNVHLTHGPDHRELIHGFYASDNPRPERLTTVSMASVLARGASLTSDYSYVVVPHYHLFPESLGLSLPVLAYIPDYLPHFFRGRGWFDEPEEEVALGKRLAAKARRVLTNSVFSSRYLPNSSLEVAADKITVFPLPFLGQAAGAPLTVPEAVAPIADEPYIFYPTQPHPHKRLDLLVMAWLLLNVSESKPVRLVLTAGKLPAKLEALVAASSMTPYLHLLPGLDDSGVEWLYSHACCLAFSSELEGNFPTQLLEALQLRCPVVCTDNPLIVEELGPLSEYLQMAPFGDVVAFKERLAHCLHEREAVLRRQSLAERQILERFSYDRFKTNVVDLHRLMTSSEELDDHV